MFLSPKKKKTITFVLFFLFLLIVFFCVYIVLLLRNERVIGAGGSEHAGITLEYNGEKKKIRPYIHTVLITGTDNFAEEDAAEEAKKTISFDAPYNDTQADFIAFMVFDLKARTVTPIQLNRDTMCDVPYLSINGKVMGTNFQQLALSHNQGSGKEDSCRNVIRAVQKLLFGAPVDHYMSLSMDAVPVINDLIGGVTVTMDDDYISDDSNTVLRKGDTITLNGSDALNFVRMRRHDRVDVNEARMGRHRLYLDAFAIQARTASEEDPNLITDSFDKVAPYMVSDLDLGSYSDFLNRLSMFELKPVQQIQGVYHMGEQWAEFYPDEDCLWEIVKNLMTKN